MDCACKLCVQVEHQTLNTLCGPGIFEKRCTLASHWIAFTRTSNIESGCFYACSNSAFQGAIIHPVTARLCMLEQQIMCDTWNFWESDSSILQRH